MDAVLHVNAELRDWKLLQIAAGFASLAAVPADRVNRESVNIAHYRRAVYSWAKADLTERYRDFDSTASSMSDKKMMEALDNAPSDQRRNAHWAIADIIGRSSHDGGADLMQVRAQQHDTLDALCWRHLGATANVVEVSA